MGPYASSTASSVCAQRIGARMTFQRCPGVMSAGAVVAHEYSGSAGVYRSRERTPSRKPSRIGSISEEWKLHGDDLAEESAAAQVLRSALHVVHRARDYKVAVGVQRREFQATPSDRSIIEALVVGEDSEHPSRRAFLP